MVIAIINKTGAYLPRLLPMSFCNLPGKKPLTVTLLESMIQAWLYQKAAIEKFFKAVLNAALKTTSLKPFATFPIHP
jgi:hypothetical protein